MKQPNEQPIEPIQSSKNIWIIIPAVIVTALIVGGGVYAWQKSNLKNTEQSFQKQITYLENQINQLQQGQIATSQPDQQSHVQQDKTSFLITGIPNLDVTLNFDKPNCAKLGLYSEFDNKYLIPVFCRKYYDNEDYIGKNNFTLEVNKTNDQEYYASDLRLLTSEYRFSEPVENSILEDYVKKYDTYIQSGLEEFRVSLYLDDELGKDEVGRWYLTKNTIGMKKDKLIYWDYCEAGCRIWPKDVIGDYILWEYNIDPSTGAGNKCWSVTGKGSYEGDKQIKCEITISPELLENLSFNLRN